MPGAHLLHATPHYAMQPVLPDHKNLFPTIDSQIPHMGLQNPTQI
jgi:hypothetical protein